MSQLTLLREPDQLQALRRPPLPHSELSIIMEGESPSGVVPNVAAADLHREAEAAAIRAASRAASRTSRSSQRPPPPADYPMATDTPSMSSTNHSLRPWTREERERIRDELRNSDPAANFNARREEPRKTDDVSHDLVL
jgi:hypothetical protein